MGMQSYQIISLQKEAEDTFVFQLKPSQTDIFTFLPGQFAKVDIPDLPSKRGHFFSIASTPSNKDYLEFAFKIYGDWTKALSEKTEGEELNVLGPYGKFAWDGSVQNAIFLAGGIGITPFMSMLRFIQSNQQKPSVTLVYCNRTEATIAYRKEVEEIIGSLPSSKIVHVLSDVQSNDVWSGYRGFLTKEMLEREVQFTNNPTFFICGPPVFVKLAKEILQGYAIAENRIKQELF